MGLMWDIVGALLALSRAHKLLHELRRHAENFSGENEARVRGIVACLEAVDRNATLLSAAYKDETVRAANLPAGPPKNKNGRASYMKTMEVLCETAAELSTDFSSGSDIEASSSCLAISGAIASMVTGDFASFAELSALAVAGNEGMDKVRTVIIEAARPTHYSFWH